MWACEESTAVQKAAVADTPHACAWLTDVKCSSCCPCCTVLLLLSCLEQRHRLGDLAYETNPHSICWSLWHCSLAPAGHSQRKRCNLKESASEPCLLLCCLGPQQDFFCVHSRYSSCATSRSQPYLQLLQQQPTSLSSKLAAFHSWEFTVSGSCWFAFRKLGEI